MHGGVAGRCPTGAAADEGAVIHFADEQLPALLHLRMATQAKIGIGLDEHLVVDGAVRLMTRSASFTQSFMLEDNAF